MTTVSTDEAGPLSAAVGAICQAGGIESGDSRNAFYVHQYIIPLLLQLQGKIGPLFRIQIGRRGRRARRIIEGSPPHPGPLARKRSEGDSWTPHVARMGAIPRLSWACHGGAIDARNQAFSGLEIGHLRAAKSSRFEA